MRKGGIPSKIRMSSCWYQRIACGKLYNVVQAASWSDLPFMRYKQRCTLLKEKQRTCTCHNYIDNNNVFVWLPTCLAGLISTVPQHVYILDIAMLTSKLKYLDLLNMYVNSLIPRLCVILSGLLLSPRYAIACEQDPKLYTKELPCQLHWLWLDGWGGVVSHLYGHVQLLPSVESCQTKYRSGTKVCERCRITNKLKQLPFALYKGKYNHMPDKTDDATSNSHLKHQMIALLGSNWKLREVHCMSKVFIHPERVCLGDAAG